MPLYGSGSTKRAVMARGSQRRGAQAMTKREKSARAQSYGVSMSTFDRMSAAQKRKAASGVGRMYTTRRTGGGDTGTSAEDLAAAWLAAQGGAGSARTHAQDLSYLQAQSRYEMEHAKWRADMESRAAQKQRAWEAEQARLQRAFEEAQERARREAERQRQIKELESVRQQTYVEMLGRDPTRAILFALGFGPEADTFNLKAQQLQATLKPLAGAAEKEKSMEEALSGLLGMGTSGAMAPSIDLGTSGVGGLPPAIKAALAYQQGPDAQKLLGSAYQVGSLPGGGGVPGISSEQLEEMVGQVTPGGVL